MNMNSKRYQLENYRKYLLNRVTATPHILEYIENCLASEDEAAHHSFHKIMIHNWAASDVDLYETLAEYFSPSYIPVNYTSQGAITSFYTSSLSLVSKIAKLDFMFPHQRNMFNIDILFNDKTSADCFENRITIDDIVNGVISNRLSDKFELDLSNFCNDPEFIQKKVHFYKIELLTKFKILMLRMGRDTKSLNLSNNNLSNVPVDILNFFMKGDLTSINLSNNNIQSIQNLHRVSSKVEKLWVEGNPLCDELDPVSYVKQLIMRFPRINELDGIKLNEHGVPIPFFKHYLVNPGKKTQMLVEKFISLYFHHYDWSKREKQLSMFYKTDAHFTLSTGFTKEEELDPALAPYLCHSRNAMDRRKRTYVVCNNKLYRKQDAIKGVLSRLPPTIHDPTSFTVDVVYQSGKHIMLVVDGVYKEKRESGDKFFQFRRTFIFSYVSNKGPMLMFQIINEMMYVSYATQEQIERAFKNPYSCTNQTGLHNPDHEDINSLTYIFSHITQLKKKEAEIRLKEHHYTLRTALKTFLNDHRQGIVPQDAFIDEDDFSDSSSLIDDID